MCWRKSPSRERILPTHSLSVHSNRHGRRGAVVASRSTCQKWGQNRVKSLNSEVSKKMPTWTNPNILAIHIDTQPPSLTQTQTQLRHRLPDLTQLIHSSDSDLRPRQKYIMTSSGSKGTSVRLWLLQGVTNTALTNGRNTSTKQKTHYEVRKRPEEHLRPSGIDGKMTRLTGESRLAIGWSDAWVRYLDHIEQIHISHKAPKEKVDATIYFIHEVLTKMDRHHLLVTRPGTKMQRLHLSRGKGSRDKTWESHLSRKLNEALKWSTQSFTARVLWVAKHKLSRVLHKRTRTPNHPGVAHTRGLRIGQDGINTAGRITNGQSNGDRQRRLVFKMKSILASENRRYNFKNTSQKLLSTRSNRLDPPSWFFVAFRVQSDRTSCWTHTHALFSHPYTTAHHPHISSVGTPHWLKVKWVARHSQWFTPISFRDVVIECPLSSVPTFCPRPLHSHPDPQPLPRPLQEGTRSLEWVWPNGWLCPKHRLRGQARQLLQLHGHNAHADQSPEQTPQLPVFRRCHRDSHQSRRFTEFRSTQQQQADSIWQSSIIVRTL